MAKRGRPSLPPEMRKNRNLTFRARAGLRQKLADEADRNERSISEEIEARLIRSFEGRIDA